MIKLEAAIDMYKQGYSDAEVMVELKMTQKEFDKRYSSDAAFRDFVDMGRTLALAWWMQQGRLNISNNKFNTNLWTFIVKNRFNWADKLEASQKGDGTTKDIATLKADIGKLMTKLTKEMGEAKGVLTDAQLLMALENRDSVN